MSTQPYADFLNATSPQRYNNYQQQPYTPVQQQPYTPPQPVITQQIVHVNGFAGADAYSMTKDSSVILLDQKEPTVYIKQTDGANYATIQCYTLVPQETPAQKAENLEERINKIEEMMEEMINAQSAFIANANANNSTSNDSKSKSNDSSRTVNATTSTNGKQH